MAAQAYPLGERPSTYTPAPVSQASPHAGEDVQKVVANLDPNQFEQWKAYLQGLPEGERAAALAKLATDYGAEAEDARERMSRADMLRVNQPRGTQGPRAYTAANPLEHLGAFAMNARANQLRQQGQEDLSSARAGKNALLSDVMRRMSGM